MNSDGRPGTGATHTWTGMKDVGFFLQLDRRLTPFVTPDDPDAFERVIERRI
jgi:hypothetical protein